MTGKEIDPAMIMALQNSKPELARRCIDLRAQRDRLADENKALRERLAEAEEQLLHLDHLNNDA